MKFGQGVYWGDGGWLAQIMGVGGKRVAGLGGLGEWVSGGRLTAGGGEVAGRACPAPTKQQTRYRAIAANPALISPLRGQLPPDGEAFFLSL